MLKRPKAGESEWDLLCEQQRFVSCGEKPAVRVQRGVAEKRGGEPEAGPHRDVVTIPDLPDDLPTLTPAPTKKSRFKAERVRFENDDPEGQMDQVDRHVTAVLSKIVERDTSSIPVCTPAFTCAAFPKVFHRSEVADQGPVPQGRRSIFAQKIAAQKAKGENGGPQTLPALAQETGNTPACPLMTPFPPTTGGQAMMRTPRLVTGLGLGRPNTSLEVQKIHEENQVKLTSMSESEILEEQKKLLTQLDPRLVDFVRSHKSQKGAQHPGSPEDTCVSSEKMEVDEPRLKPPITMEELPVKPQKEWLHMDQLETEKLEWMRDLPPPRKKSTKKAMQARFNFDGALIPPTEDLPNHLGLHHHGEDPELAGYSLQELFLLARSQLTQQRTLALTTLARVIAKARSGAFASSLKGSMTSTLLDAGVVFLLRFALDDSVEGVMAAAVQGLRALLVPLNDEECLDGTFSWLLGMSTFPLLPSAQEEEDEDDENLHEALRTSAKEKEESRTDHDVARQDVVKGFLQMKLLPRLRYILEVVRPPPRTVLDVLEILIRIARHSTWSATRVVDCPRLLPTVMEEFLPLTWSPPASTTTKSLYGQPVAVAMKLVRVLASAGRHACARLLNSGGARERLSRLLAQEPQELLMDQREALVISTEALRLWAVAAGYGQACDLYREFYPVLVKALQSGSRFGAPECSFRLLELQRSQALVTLLTQVTLTAGCHQDLEAGLLSPEGAEHLPPPPVNWSHVTGLQPTLLATLKVCVGMLEEPSQRECGVSLLPSHLLYLAFYYRQLSAQVSFKPVECLQELEALTREVLLPLLSSKVVLDLMANLRSCSHLCNPLSCRGDPESVGSLPTLGCSAFSPALCQTGGSSPFPLLTALCFLLESVCGVHRGLAGTFSPLLLCDAVSGYLHACCLGTPAISHSSAWLLRHEHHALYHLLKLARRLVPVSPEVATQASLYHQVAVIMVSWLLPGSEHLAHDLLSTVIFNPDFIPEGRCGGAEAADLSQLQLQESVWVSPPGPLLRDACAELPLLRSCYLTHLSWLEPAVLSSRHVHLGHTHRVSSFLLPEGAGPVLPSDWPYLPLVRLYERAGGSESSDPMLGTAVHCLQWLLVLEVWRGAGLRRVPPAARLSRLCCLFLCSSEMFLERPVQLLTRCLLRLLDLAALDLAAPLLPGVASFHDLYVALLVQFEAVSFGDPLFGCFLLLPLQRRFPVTLRLAVFGEHVGLLRSLGVTLEQLPVSLEHFTSPAEDSLALLRLYFRSLVTGALRQAWCPVLYVVALAHLNSFIFSQDATSQETDATRRSLLRKTYYLTNAVLKTHLLLFRAPRQHAALGFDSYEQLPPIRAHRLQEVLGVGIRAEGAGTVMDRHD